ncbi:MAG: phytanoyl-CoA dioxygenase family protein [Cyanobacteria bacterium P01_H01_bin.150]
MTTDTNQPDVIASEQLTTIKITPEELADGEMSPCSCKQAVRAVNTYGYVILENAVPHECIDILNQKMEEDTKKLLVKPNWNTIGKVKGHLQPSPPHYAPYVFRELVSNYFAAQVTKQVFGNNTFVKSYSSNTNCPGSHSQPIHVDGEHSALIVNIGLIDITENNGSIELWPGTHLIKSDSARIAPSILKARRKIAPPIRANTKKGSVLIRHTQVWHRGMPNYSNSYRHTIATMHHKYGSDFGEPLKFKKGCEQELNNRILYPNIEFTDELINSDSAPNYSFVAACKDTAYRLSPETLVFATKLYRRVLKRKG